MFSDCYFTLSLRVYLSYHVPKHYITTKEKSLETLSSAKATSSFCEDKWMKIGTMGKSMGSMAFFPPTLCRSSNLYLSPHLSARHFTTLKWKTRRLTKIAFPSQRWSIQEIAFSFSGYSLTPGIGLVFHLAKTENSLCELCHCASKDTRK